MEGLTPGRIVHYVDQFGAHLAATVSRVWDDQAGRVNLHVFDPDGSTLPGAEFPPVYVKGRVSHSPSARPGTWHWIERA